jgi:hypothetical protein
VKNEYDITELEELRGSLDVLESYEPDSLDVVALLFQTGYIIRFQRYYYFRKGNFITIGLRVGRQSF